MRILLVLSHSIEEHDQLKLLHGLSYEVFSLGGYIDPAHPHDPKRPALPEVPHHADLHAAVDALGVENNIGAAASRIPEQILEWADVIIFHHYLERLYAQWDYLREWRAGGGRVIWRTVGQSVEANERTALPYRADGLEVVRYSAKEAAIPGYCGRDALIRFYKDPAEWRGWTGESAVVGNVTQDLLGRHPWTNAEFYLRATEDLAAAPAGPGSEKLSGGHGSLEYEEMKRYLREARCYLYAGTQPASYTLGLLEALVTGVPVVSIEPSYMTLFPYGPELFEGHELSPLSDATPEGARAALEALLEDPGLAAQISQHQRWRACKEFGAEPVGAAWREYLGT